MLGRIGAREVSLTVSTQPRTGHGVRLRVSGHLGPGVGVLQWAQLARATAVLPGLAAMLVSDEVHPDPAIVLEDGRIRRGPAIRWTDGHTLAVEVDGLGRSQPTSRNSYERVADGLRAWSFESVTYRNPYDATVLAAVSLVTGGNIINLLTWLSTRKSMRRGAALEAEVMQASASSAQAKSEGEVAELEARHLRQLAEARRFHAEASKLEVEVALDILAYYDEHQPGHRWDLATALLLVRNEAIGESLATQEQYDLTFSLVPTRRADGGAIEQST
jgi:hypothetical protein